MVMIRVHHLENSRSQRILWFLEELGVPYEIVFYKRDATTSLAPPELKAVHPLGKSPVIEDGDLKIAESGAIVEYLAEHYGDGAWLPMSRGHEAVRHREWLHFAEGSAILPFILGLYVGRLGAAGAPLEPRISSEIANFLSYMETGLGEKDWFGGAQPMAADIMLSFIGEIARAGGRLGDYPRLDAWVKRFQARPAYRRALEKGGPYRFAG
ncbi:MAG: glutathione S-transferase [Rhodothalassiaceae bacterium]